MITTSNIAAPLVFGIIILMAVLVFWVVPRRRLRRSDVESNHYIAPRRMRPVSTYKPPSQTDMDLPPYPAPAHMGPDDPVPSYEEATGQSRQGAQEPPGYRPGNNANAARAS